MKHAAAIAILIVLCLFTGCAGSKQAADSDTDHEALLGTWYLQQSYGLEVEPGFRSEQQLFITFHPDGRVEGLDWYGDPETGTYTVDREDRVIEMHGEKESGLLRYTIVEDVLLLGEVPHADNAEDPLVVLEWSRTPKGSARHQALDHLLSRKPLPSQISQSNENLGQMLMLILNEYERTGVMPPSLAQIVMENQLDPTSIFLPWTERTLPDNFKESTDERKALILSAYSEYIYLFGETFVGDDKFDRDELSIILFEDPFYKDLEDMALGFSDGTVRRLPKSEASKLLKAQTGYSLVEWRSLLN